MASPPEEDGFLKQLQDGFYPHVLDMPVSEDPTDGTAMAIVLVVLKKDSGILLAVEEFFPEEVLSAGLLAGPDEVIGPSHRVAVPGGVWDPVTGGDPVADPDSTVPVILLDALPGIADSLKLFNPAADAVEVIQHFMDPRSDLFPMPDALLAAAMEWVTNPSAGERVNYYYAEDDGEEEQEKTALPGPTPKGPKAKGIPAGGQQPPGTGGGGKPGANPKIKKPTVATLASSVDALVTALPAISNQLAELTRRQAEVEQKFQQGTRISALAAPLGGASTVGLSGASPKFHQMLSEMPPPQRCGYCCSGGCSNFIRFSETGGGQAVGGRDRDGRLGSGSCSLGSESGPHSTGWTDRSECRPVVRHQLILDKLLFPWCNGEDKVAAGAGNAERHVFRVGLSEHGEKDEPLPDLRSATNGALPERSICYKVLGAFRWLWEGERLGANSLAGWHHHGPSSVRQSGSGERCYFAPPGLSRTRSSGCRASRDWSSFGSFRRSPCRVVQQQEFGSPISGEKFCTSGRAKVDQSGAELHKGAGCDYPETCRFGRSSCEEYCCTPSVHPDPKTEPKAKEGCLEEESEKPRRSRRRGVKVERKAAHVPECKSKPGFNLGSKNPKPNKDKLGSPAPSLSESITFPVLLASLPRWILKCRTPFSGFLAKT